ncbi:MAG TPA: glutamine-hydrolyzing carbamoyl-phosphate synthase small subunit [Bacteroidota bacterium]|nr:glutamine-hydrolyzing carbamoyl-phosphate synthase small subunit [Bacteroidota bacterium]
MKAKLSLENGTVFEAEAFGAPGEVAGEVVFNTSLSGYQEIFTDPSYAGQIVTMTYPLIGNYGVNGDDLESALPQVRAIIVREYSEIYSNFRATKSLASWLKEHSVMAIQGLDTRMLTKMLRTDGALRGVISTTDMDESSLARKVAASPLMNGLDLATKVTCEQPYSWDEEDLTPFALGRGDSESHGGRRFKVVAYDYGIKRNILRRLVHFGCVVTVVPAQFPAADVMAMKPDGVFLSNGPGDPAAVKVAISNIKNLLGKVPVFGICLGHQLLALALGGKTYKLKFGHRGGNHPVIHHATGRIEITSQNHGFAVDTTTLDQSSLEITHTNLYDHTNEGFRHKELPVFSVQYHPEASPGPHDSDYLFSDFIAMMKSGKPSRIERPVPAR